MAWQRPQARVSEAGHGHDSRLGRSGGERPLTRPYVLVGTGLAACCLGARTQEEEEVCSSTTSKVPLLRPSLAIVDATREKEVGRSALMEGGRGGCQATPAASLRRAHPRRRAGQPRGLWSPGRSIEPRRSANERSFLSLPTSTCAGSAESRSCLAKSNYTNNAVAAVSPRVVSSASAAAEVDPVVAQQTACTRRACSPPRARRGGAVLNSSSHSSHSFIQFIHSFKHNL